ncbi:MAG: FecR domain-containing protein [Magnetovibrionaceae bacterium]
MTDTNHIKEPIGTVDNVEGPVSILRADGQVIEAEAGSPVFQGDRIDTGADGNIGVVFADETTFSLGEEGSLVIDEMVYDSAANEGSSAFNVIQGVFTFVSGEIAKTSPDAMVVQTPVMTIGVRGTTVAGEAGPEGTENTITLLEDANGHTGEIVVQTDAGLVVMNDPFQHTAMSSRVEAPKAPKIIDRSEVESRYGDAKQAMPAPRGDYAPQEDSPAEAEDADQTAIDPSEEEESAEISGEELTAQEIALQAERLAEAGLDEGRLEDALVEELLGELLDGGRPVDAIEQLEQLASLEQAGLVEELIGDLDLSGVRPVEGSNEQRVQEYGIVGEALVDEAGQLIVEGLQGLDVIFGTDSLTADFNTFNQVRTFGLDQIKVIETVYTAANENREEEEEKADDEVERQEEAEFFNVSASLEDDLLVGNAEGNTFVMAQGENLGGADVVYGRGGNDALVFENLRDVEFRYDAAAKTFHYASAEGAGQIEIHNIEGFHAKSGGDDKWINLGESETGYGYLLVGGEANDYLQASEGAGFDFLDGTVDGNAQGAVIFGNEGHDTIVGSGTGDHLFGGTGNDFFVGSEGRDEITGGTGTDGFYYNDAAQFGDTVTDFETGADYFMLSASGIDGGFNTRDAGGDAANVSTGGSTVGQAFDLHAGGDLDDGTMIWDLGTASSLAEVKWLLNNNIVTVSDTATSGNYVGYFTDGRDTHLVNISISGDTDTSDAEVTEIAALENVTTINADDVNFVA